MSYLVAFLVLMFGTSVVRADLDPQTKKPYELQVILHVAANRTFTPLFQDQLQRDVQNHLRLAFGDLTRIDVTREHPLLREIEAKGLDSAIDGWDSLSDRTTHFVLVDYVAGVYQVQTRFHDGPTGNTGAQTHKRTVTDRTALAVTIAELIEAAFAPIGTVTSVSKSITLTLKGGDLGVKMDRWVKPGHVFAVSRINEQNGRTRAERIEWALLEVRSVTAGGVCSCEYWHRYQEDTLQSGGGTLGFRAMRLATSPGLLRLQLLDDTTLTLKPVDGLHLRIQSGKYEETLLTNRDGLAITKKPIGHFAQVQILSGTSVRAQFPVERIEGRTVVARVKPQGDRDGLGTFEARRDAWLRRGYENMRMSSERVTELAGLLNQSLEAARDTGQKRLPLLEEEIKYLDREQDELTRLAKEKKTAFDPREGQQQIDELRQRAKGLQAFIARLDKVLSEPDSDKAGGLVKLLERARLFEAEADFEQAIRLYDQVIQASPEQKTVKAHLDSLKNRWQLKDDTHGDARRFIYEVWPTLDVAGVQKNLDRAKDTLRICRDAGDKLTPRKMLRANVAHTVNLKKQLDTLKRRDSEDNRNQAKILGQTSETLLRLHTDAAAWIGTK